MKDIRPKCIWCSKPATDLPMASVVAVGQITEEGVDLRAVDQSGILRVGPYADDAAEAAEVMKADPLVADDNALIWVKGSDEWVLDDLGEAWAKAKEVERIAAAAAYAAIRWAAANGLPETQIASRLNVDRMTVRRALGKL